jgi:hypothetical protein
MAGKCQVGKLFGATMLFGNDVLNVVREITVLLLEQTVFAAIPGSLTDQVPQFGVGHGWVFEVSLRWALSFRIAMKSAALIRAS